jgi:hypothetical protein
LQNGNIFKVFGRILKDNGKGVICPSEGFELFLIG